MTARTLRTPLTSSLAVAILTLVLLGSPTAARAQDDVARAGGDDRHIQFTLPYADAVAKAKAENRLLFLKPIYGGVDAAGAKDYRCGSW